MSKSRPLSVYVIASPDGEQKIGITDNLAVRIKPRKRAEVRYGSYILAIGR